MRVIRSLSEMQCEALRLKREGVCLGFVPTMGYLHEGHRSLMRLARTRADLVVVSIFVNPTQFGAHEDLGSYPRDFSRDEQACIDEGVDLLFYPDADSMYVPDATVYVNEDRLTRAFEGAERPGHFRGVLTIVAKLFHLVQPDLAVFGRKDAQQLAAVRRMVRDLNMPVEIVPGATVREPDGLAMSSRNVYLNEDERRQARCLRRALDEAGRRVAAGACGAGELREAMQTVLQTAPLACPDYVEIVDEITFEPVPQVAGPSLAVLAVRFGATRLLDNALLTVPDQPVPGAPQQEKQDL